MKTIKILCVILLGLLIAVLLAGCENGSVGEIADTSSAAETTVDTVIDTESVENVIEYILTSDIVKYNIVRPEDASTALVDATAAFYREVMSIYGDKIRLKDDFVIPGNAQYSAAEFEILVGNTNRDETAEFMKQLRVNDYGYAVIGKKIVIVGGSDAATALAIDKFMAHRARAEKGCLRT